MMKKQSWFQKLMLHLFGMNPPPVAPPAPIPVPTPEPHPPAPDPLPDTTGNRLASAKWAGFPKLAIVCDLSGWPVKSVRGKQCAGMLMLNGKKVEWLKAGSANKLTSLHNAVTDPDYMQPLPKGAEIEVSVADINGRNESNRIKLIVP